MARCSALGEITYILGISSAARHFGQVQLGLSGGTVSSVWCSFKKKSLIDGCLSRTTLDEGKTSTKVPHDRRICVYIYKSAGPVSATRSPRLSDEILRV
jgi:hypothetical protein